MLPAKQPYNAYHTARNGLSVVSPTPELEQPPTIGLKPLPGMSGWWWQTPNHKEPGGIWRSAPHSLEQELPWCPEVLSRLTALDTNRTPRMDYFTIRIHSHIATLSQTEIFDMIDGEDKWNGSAWNAEMDLKARVSGS
ncbi:hypothetical protein ACWGBU_39955 [Streptomyces vinaceus]